MPQSIDSKLNIFFYIVIFFFLSTINNISWNNNKESYLKVKKIQVNGLNNDLNLKIKKKLEYLIGKNIFFLSQKDIEKELNSISYIENYKVSKLFPSKVKIDLNKTQLIAMTYKNNEKLYIGKNKKFINFIEEPIDNNFPLIFGNFEIKEFFDLRYYFKKYKFDIEQIQEYYYFPSKRWDIKLKNGMIIKLPIENIDNALKVLAKILSENIRGQNKIIDLRVTNQIIFSNE